jgi:hypothetical protein
MAKELNESILSEMLGSLADSFTKERQKSEPYKEMFKAGSTHTGLLRSLEGKMSDHILDACDIFKERHGVKINHNQYHVLLALPLLAVIAENNARANEGMACCVDKAYFLLSEQLIALSDSPSNSNL